MAKVAKVKRLLDDDALDDVHNRPVWEIVQWAWVQHLVKTVTGGANSKIFSFLEVSKKDFSRYWASLRKILKVGPNATAPDESLVGAKLLSLHPPQVNLARNRTTASRC